MSEFIEISKGVCVNKSQVAWVAKSTDEMGSVISCGGKEYPSDLPYETVVMILQQQSEPDKYERVMKKLNTYLDNAQIWAG